MLHWVSGWVDWNMALDPNGGPNYISNFVESTIIVNATAAEFYKQPIYYHLGHFSKFVPRGSVRIDSNVVSSDSSTTVDSVAFRRPDNSTAVIILNRFVIIISNTLNFFFLRNPLQVLVNIIDSTRGTAPIQITENSITTVLYW